MSHRGMRTCVGCRGRAGKDELLRVVVGEREADREVRPDPDGTAAGRGAYLHPGVACLERALGRRALPRALRVTTGLDTSRIERHAREHDASSTTSTS